MRSMVVVLGIGCAGCSFATVQGSTTPSAGELKRTTTGPVASTVPFPSSVARATSVRLLCRRPIPCHVRIPSQRHSVVS